MGFLCFPSPKQRGNGGGGRGRSSSTYKRHLPIKVGVGGDETSFLVPLLYLTHPLFMLMLKRAEEEYGFHQKGTIKLPCNVNEFITIQKLIDSDHRNRNSVYSTREISIFLSPVPRMGID